MNDLFLRHSFALAVLFIAISSPGISFAQGVSTGILNIDSAPTGASVFVDGKMRGKTPVLVEVQATSHEIVVKHNGYQPHRESIIVKQNKVLRTTISLKKKSPAKSLAPKKNPPAIKVKKGIKVYVPKDNDEPGTIFLTTAPKSLTAYVNGFKISKTTPVAFDIRPGIYELQLKNDTNEIVYKKTVFVRSGKTLSMDIIIQKKRTIDYTDPWK